MSTWHEIAVEGNLAALRGFLAAFEAFTGSGALLGVDLEIEPTGLSGRIRRMLRHGEHHHVYAPDGASQKLEQVLAEHGADAELEVVGRAEVVSAGFDFSAEVYRPELVSELRSEFLSGLPEGVTLVDPVEEEEKQAGDGVPGLYDPAHEYRFRASGRIVGPFVGVLEMHRRARQLEPVTTGKMRLELHELTQH